MPKKIPFHNDAFRGVQAQDGYTMAPDNGEVFLYGGSDSTFSGRGFYSPVNVRSGDQIYSYDPIQAYNSSPEGKLYQAGVKMNFDLLGVNGQMGGSQASTPNFGDPWTYINKFARDNKIPGDPKYSGPAQAGGMAIYQKLQDDYYNKVAGDYKKLVLDKVNSLDFDPADKKAFVDLVNSYTPKPGQAGGRFAGYDQLFNQFLATKNVPYGDGRNPNVVDQSALQQKGYTIIQDQLKAKGINVNIAALPMYNQGDLSFDTSLKKGSGTQISDSTGFDKAITQALPEYQKATQAVGNQVADIKGNGPGAADYKGAIADGFAAPDQSWATGPATTQRPNTPAEAAAIAAQEAKDRLTGAIQTQTPTYTSPTLTDALAGITPGGVVATGVVDPATGNVTPAASPIPTSSVDTAKVIASLATPYSSPALAAMISPQPVAPVAPVAPQYSGSSRLASALESPSIGNPDQRAKIGSKKNANIQPLAAPKRTRSRISYS